MVLMKHTDLGQDQNENIVTLLDSVIAELSKIEPMYHH